jgi:hypothetical protein
MERAAALTACNKTGVAAAENMRTTAHKTITDQDPKLATAKAALDKFLIKSPGDGKVTAVAKAKAKVTPTDVIATLTRDPVVVATFKSAGEVAVGTRVLLAVKGTDQKLSCTVAQAGGDGVKIACPAGAAADGTEVTYAGVDPNAPPPGETPPAGSGATAPAGSGAAPAETPAGSDATKPEEKAAEDKPAEKPAEKPAPEKKIAPQRRPRQKRPPAETPAGSGETPPPPADKPAEPAPAPAPAPEGSGTP